MIQKSKLQNGFFSNSDLKCTEKKIFQKCCREKSGTDRWGRISRIWLISITVGNAAYPVKKKKKFETNPIKRKRKRKREIFEAKYVLNSIGVSCLVSFAASREERVVKRVGYDLTAVLRRLTCDRDGDQAKVGLWGGGGRGEGDERSELEIAEAAIATAIGFDVLLRKC